VYTDNIWDDHAWSEPIYFDNPGFDQDVCPQSLIMYSKKLTKLSSSSRIMMARFICQLRLV
jgi:hypothetical protein